MIFEKLEKLERSQKKRRQKAYADRVAQEAFEQAVAAGQPFDRAVAAGRAAHEDAEARFTAGQAALAAEAPAWKPQQGRGTYVKIKYKIK